jgi:hypothetical protein
MQRGKKRILSITLLVQVSSVAWTGRLIALGGLEVDH